MNVGKSNNIYTLAGNCVTPSGFNLSENIEAIQKKNIAIQEHNNQIYSSRSFYGGIIDNELLNQTIKNNIPLADNFSKLEKMMLLSLNNIKANYLPILNNRCGLIIASTKGNIDRINLDDEDYLLSQLGRKIARSIGITSDPIVVSNACVSGIMAVSIAKRLIQAGIYDHIVISAGDLFSPFVFSGFQSFHAVSSNPCKPYSVNRDGITLGEAAASMLITRDQNITDSTSYIITGDSSINDANHISGPSRNGEGLYKSIEEVLRNSNVSANDVDCICAHGTATKYNDEMESQAFNRSNLHKTPVFSLKGFFGHTLGAAGLLETVVSLELANRKIIPPSFGYDLNGLTLPLAISTGQQNAQINTVLKTASGFGGVNTAVLFQKIKKGLYVN